MRVLITGGAGYIGAHACKALTRAGYTPTVMVIDTTPDELVESRGLVDSLFSARRWKQRVKELVPASVWDRVDSRSLESIRPFVQAGLRAMQTYRPMSVDVDVVVVRTQETFAGTPYAESDLGWGRLARSVRTIDIPGRHLDVFRTGVCPLAKAVQAEIDLIKAARSTTRGVG